MLRALLHLTPRLLLLAGRAGQALGGSAAPAVADSPLPEAPAPAAKGKKPIVPIMFTTDSDKLAACNHMLLLLDARTWTSGEDTASFVEHIHEATRTGVHNVCDHEYPSVAGPERIASE